MTASVYGWLTAQGLWPTLLAATLYWAVPIALGFLLGGRAYRQLLAVWREHVRVQREKAAHLAAISAHLQTLAARPPEPPEPRRQRR